MTAIRLPWLRWFPRDFASSTRGWPLVARAVYRELLDAQWDIGGADVGTLPDDETALRALVGATPAEWRIAWAFVATKFPKVEGGRRNARIEDHREIAIREYHNRRKGAQITNQTRWGNKRTVAQRSPSDSVSDHSVSRPAISERVAERVAHVSQACESHPDPAPAPDSEYGLNPYEGGGTPSERPADGQNFDVDGVQ